MAGESINKVTISVHVEGQQALKALGRIEKGFGKVGTSASRGAKGIDRMSRSMNGMIRNMKRFAALAIAAFGAREIFQYTEALASVNIAFETIGKSADVAAAGMEAVEQISEQSSTQFRQLAEQARFLFAVGFRDIDKLKEILADVDDLAAGLGANFQQISFALAQVKAIGFLRGEEARQFLNANIGIEKSLSDQSELLFGQKFTLGEIRKLVERRRISADATVAALRLFAREQNVVGVSQRLLQENPVVALRKTLDDVLRILGEFTLAFRGEIGSAVQGLREFLKMVQRVKDPVIDFIKAVIFWLGQLRDTIVETFSKTTLGGGISAFLSTFGSALLQYVKDFTAATLDLKKGLGFVGPTQPAVNREFEPGQFELLSGEATGNAASRAQRQLSDLALRSRAIAAEHLLDLEKERLRVLQKETEEYTEQLQAILGLLQATQQVQGDSLRRVELFGLGERTAQQLEAAGRNINARTEILRREARERQEIELRAIQRTFDLELEALNNRLAAGQLVIAQYNAELDNVTARRAAEIQDIILTTEAEISRIGRDRRRTIREEQERAWQQTLDAARNAGEQLFDALIRGTNDWGRVLRSTILASLLTPLRTVAGQMSQILFAPLMGQIQGFGGPVLKTAGGPGNIAGLAGIAGVGGGALGLLRSLGGIGMGGAGNLAGLGGGLGGLSSGGAAIAALGGSGGIGGALGGGLLLGGGGLAAAGLARGGLSGALMTAGGGALIGAKFGGGPLGAGIGAAIGLGAGLIRNLFKRPEERIVEKVRQLYGLTIDRSFAGQLWEVIQSNYGGNIEIGVRSHEVQDLLELYRLQSAAGGNVIGNRAQSVTIGRSGGSLVQTVGLSSTPNFQLNPGLADITVVMPNAVAVWEGANMKIASESPHVTAAANSRALESNAGRVPNYALQAQPGLLT